MPKDVSGETAGVSNKDLLSAVQLCLRVLNKSLVVETAWLAIEELVRRHEYEPSLFPSNLWRKEPSTKDTVFIWAYWDPGKNNWQTGLGYWTVTKGQWRDAYNQFSDIHRRATHFHPMPAPPRGQ